MPLAEPSTDPSSPSIDAAAAALLRLLLIETYRDGGAAYATSYRDGGGGSAGRIPSLLREAGKKAGLRRSGPLRLLDFVDGLGPGAPLVTPAGGWGGDRGPPPHVVRIVGEEGGGRSAFDAARSIVEEEERREGGAPHAAAVAQAACVLHDRMRYRLRQNLCKLERRRERQRRGDGCEISVRASGHGPQGASASGGSSVPWLVKKCAKELHEYARLLPQRPMGSLPMSKGWGALAGPVLLDFVRSRPECFFVEKSGLVHLREAVGGCGGDAAGSVDLASLSAKLRSVLRQAGNSVGGIDAGRAMADPGLRSLLGGRELISIVLSHPAQFEGLEVYQDGRRGGAWYVRAENGVGEDSDRDPEPDRLLADEVGTYSLTDAKSALAMARHLLRATEALRSSDASAEGAGEPLRPIAIDLTAGVGGNTLGLARLFPRVVAYEIDPARFELLRRNVAARSLARGQIDLRCGDSMAALGGELGLGLGLRDGGGRGGDVGVLIDPPFGGVHYRIGRPRTEDGDLSLGGLPLSGAVARVGRALAPCAVGVKLPLTFHLDGFVDRLRGALLPPEDEAGGGGGPPPLACRVAVVCRLRRNLFVVVSLFRSGGGRCGVSGWSQK